MPGPPPKRSNQRRRTNKPDVPITKGFGAAEVPIPEADEEWHSVVLQWWDSITRSGQVAFYEPSDWGLAYLIADQMSRDLGKKLVINPITGAEHWIEQSIAGVAMSNYLKAMTALLLTEGDRRRARIELERPKPTPATGPDGPGGEGVAYISDIRKRRNAG